MKKYRIGCSGYYYPYWKNHFYPANVPQKDWLNYYSTIFNTVELNAPFYRMPKLKDLEKAAKSTTSEFNFSVKVNKFITHNKKLKDCKKEIDEFQDLVLNGLKEKFGMFLFQMPPQFHFSSENLERVITSIPHQPHNTIEFRHQSWWNEETEKSLKKANITFCNVDYPGIKSYFIHSSSNFYLRLHGSPQLFRSPYSHERLKSFLDEFPSRKKNYYIYFNNSDRGAAFQNALELKQMGAENQ